MSAVMLFTWVDPVVVEYPKKLACFNLLVVAETETRMPDGCVFVKCHNLNVKQILQIDQCKFDVKTAKCISKIADLQLIRWQESTVIRV
jgi:hypothetical protein